MRQVTRKQARKRERMRRRRRGIVAIYCGKAMIPYENGALVVSVAEYIRD